MRGEVQSMQESFAGLGYGLLMAVALVYLVMVAQFRSFLDPLIILIAVPLGVVGVIGILLLTGTTVNVQSYIGTIFMVGIAVSNSVLLVEFANRLRAEGAAVEGSVVGGSAGRLGPLFFSSIPVLVWLLPLGLPFT